MMLGLGLLAAGAARAEMTEADKEGMHVFAACLDENGGDENNCLEKLGRYAWYPRDDATCEAVGARVNEAISGGGHAELRDLFFNERCARLGLPHDTEAAKDKNSPNLGLAYDACLDETHNPLVCDDRLGRHKYYPVVPGMCSAQGKMMFEVYKASWQPLWSSFFENERCRRLGEPYFEPKT